MLILGALALSCRKGSKKSWKIKMLVKQVWTFFGKVNWNAFWGFINLWHMGENVVAAFPC